MTVDTSIPNINEDAVVGFVGGVDSPVINDFLIGFIEGAQSVNPDIKVDTRYTNDYVDTAIAKEYGLSMINDNKCDIIWVLQVTPATARQKLLRDWQGMVHRR